MARLCTDVRMDVRGHAIRDLQRALLVQDLNQLSAIEWEACFSKVLFPLLSLLLDKSNLIDPSGLEETRFRASTLLSKVTAIYKTAAAAATLLSKVLFCMFRKILVSIQPLPTPFLNYGCDGSKIV